MVNVIGIDTVSYFIPIFAFLFVMIVTYAIMQKLQILGDNPTVYLMLSILFAAFFIVNVQLVDFVTFTSSWVAVIFVFLFFLFVAVAFVPNIDLEKLLGGGDNGNQWFGWVVLVGMIIFFIVSSSYVFQWAINWDWLTSSTDSEWFGFILLVVIGGVVSFILKPAKS